MKNLLCLASALLAIMAAPGAHAAGITDSGAQAYWGADGSSAGTSDVIGGSTYDIQGAFITRIGTVLTISIFTNFAGHAGTAASTTYNNKGIGYGDVFLKNIWNPSGTDAHHTGDKATNSTVWSYGLNLDDRWDNGGGEFTLYKLMGDTNAKNITNSDTYMTKCLSSNGCNYRNTQEVSVKTYNNTDNVKNTGLSGNWTVIKDKEIKFTIDVGGTDLMNFAGFAMHWGETCQNDVIEGFTGATPEPESIALLMLGLGALAWTRRRPQR